MAKTFKVGDIVRLNSGGPDMVVTHIWPYVTVGLYTMDCAWMHEGMRMTTTLPSQAVAKVGPDVEDVPDLITLVRTWMELNKGKDLKFPSTERWPYGSGLPTPGSMAWVCMQAFDLGRKSV